MRGVRVRATAGAVLVVGVALLTGAVGLVSVTRDVLTDQVAHDAQLRAGEVVAVLGTGVGTAGLAVGEQDEQIIQVVDGTGRVIASSSNVTGLPVISDVAPGDIQRIDVPIDEDRFIAVSSTGIGAQGPFTVVVGRSLQDAVESTETITRLLVLGLPVLLVLVGLTAWRVVGRSLAPVEAIRREVDEISGSQLHRRVPDPPGSDEVARLSLTMNRMLDRLELAQTTQRRFISDASHELRSPVASIRQHVEVALAHPELTSTVELAQTVLAEDLRVQRLVEGLLLLARVDEHTLQLRRRPTDLDDLVFAEAARLREISDLRIDTSLVSAGRIDGDAAALAGVLRNLGDNAARHAATRIWFTLKERAGQVVLTVDDDGPGIPAADRSRVFERFVRLDDARARHDGGSGLGLAIVSDLVQAHGGVVRCLDGALGAFRIEVVLPGTSAQRADQPQP